MDHTNKYGRIYHEICNGYSKQLLNNSYIYFKHPTLSEYFSYYLNYELYEEQGRKKGIFSEEDKIKDAINGGWWSSEKESSINFLKITIKNLYKTKSKLVLPSQKKEIETQIKKNEAILLSYSKERNEIVGYTIEQYANSCLTEDLLINFIYKDQNFENKFFKNKSEYDDFEESELSELKNYFSNYSKAFDQYSLKCIAACGFFQNLVYLNEDAYSFWGKPTVQCSKYQIDLLLYGKMFKNIIKNSAENGKPVPDEVTENPERFVEWIDNEKSGSSKGSKRSKTGGKNSVSSYVGATKEDLDKMGVKVEKIGGKSLLQLAAEKGGELDKNEYLNLRENV